MKLNTVSRIKISSPLKTKFPLSLGYFLSIIHFSKQCLEATYRNKNQVPKTNKEKDKT